MIYGGIEAGGTKWVCATGSGPEDIRGTTTFPTTTPEETLARAIAFFREAGEPLAALGVGSFGPIDLDRNSPRWGWITSTPKEGWRDTDVAGPLAAALACPLAFDTDVNAAALAEHHWGAAQGLASVFYITVGTGIGAGCVIDGAPLHGLVHPEFGHLRVPHDRERDPFPGSCPYHGDCLEGLASGQALRARWGKPAELLHDPAVWELEADYLAVGVVNALLTLSPHRVVLGGGVSAQPTLLPLVRARVVELVGGYVDLDARAGGIERYLVAPGLGERSGVLGALELARLAAR